MTAIASRSTDYGRQTVTIRRQDLEDRSVVTVSGELDLRTSEQLETALADLLPQVEIDLTEVSFLDAAAIRCLVVAAHSSREGGGDFSVTGIGDFQRRLIDLLDLTEPLGLWSSQASTDGTEAVEGPR